MTTRMIVVNFGPGVLEATYPLNSFSPSARVPVKIFPQQTAEFVLYDRSDVLIKEVPNTPET